MISKLKYNILLVSLIGAGLTSCTDEFDNHYNQDMETVGKLNVSCFQYLENNNEYSTFVELLKKTEYDKVLASAQNFTIWAPTNDVLTEVKANIANSEFMKQNPDYIYNIVENHIALFSYSTSGLTKKSVRMKNGKLQMFTNIDGEYSIGEQKLTNVNKYIAQAVNNGIIYKLNDSFIPYKYNIWEFIGKTEGLDSLKKFIYHFDELELDKSLSVQIGTDGNGDPVYDTVWMQKNIIINQIGKINTEDSIYTALLPNNNAWDRVYGKSKSAFSFDVVANQYTQQEADSLANYYAGLNIMSNTIFRKVPDNILELTTDKDSIYSTVYRSYTSPARLFENSVLEAQVSNGKVIITDSIALDKSELLQSKLIISAGATAFGREVKTYDKSSSDKTQVPSGDIVDQTYNYSYIDKHGDLYTRKVSFILLRCASGNYYPMKTPSVFFPIPNTLSDTYNIYVKFRTTTDAGDATPLPYLVGFNMEYNLNGKKTTISANSGKSIEIPADQSEPYLVFENFKFPHCNLIDFSKDFEKSDIKVKMEVQTHTKRTDDNKKYKRDIMIESVILEPVE